MFDSMNRIRGARWQAYVSANYLSFVVDLPGGTTYASVVG